MKGRTRRTGPPILREAPFLVDANRTAPGHADGDPGISVMWRSPSRITGLCTSSAVMLARMLITTFGRKT